MVLLGRVGGNGLSGDGGSGWVHCAVYSEDEDETYLWPLIRPHFNSHNWQSINAYLKSLSYAVIIVVFSQCNMLCM